MNSSETATHFHSHLHRQIPVMMALSLLPGLGYILIGWLHGVHQPAIAWYVVVCLVSLWGYRLYRQFSLPHMSHQALQSWRRQLHGFYYLFFALWTVIYLLYLPEYEYKLHYIALFTQIGAATVAAVLLYPAPSLFKPIIPAMTIPLAIYFLYLGEWYGYLLSCFSMVFAWVLYYSAYSSYRLLLKTTRQANHDNLTGLYNRRYFVDYLQRQINTLNEYRGHSFLLLIDLDYFKTVNDSLGHEVGDQLLREIAFRMNHLLPNDQVLARLGGDEFVVVGGQQVNESDAEHEARSIAHELLQTLKKTYIISDHHIHISASIGIRLISPDALISSDLIREADIAMYQAKANGRNGAFLFSSDISEQVEKHLEIERLLHFALEKQEITLYYQPQVDSERKVIGAECLARWHNNQLGEVSPAQFIPIAEKTGFIIELGTHILRHAFSTLREWTEQGIELEHFAINISVRQFMHDGFVETVATFCQQHLKPQWHHKLVFEITETVVAEDLGRVITIMQQLKALGIRFSMDDFGTGYSSLNLLKQLPIDEVKIDRSFINELASSEDDQAMVLTILGIARTFNLTVVAEGVEQDEQRAFLKEHKCGLMQGYHFARPMPAADFLTYCQAHH